LYRLLLEAITMTASDLSASAKPWELQVKTVKVIFQEFYEQVNQNQQRSTTRRKLFTDVRINDLRFIWKF
jgi:hypothetical protein